MTSRKTTARKAAFDALMRVEGGGYSTLTLDGILEASSMQANEKALASALLYGVLEKRLLLNEIIRQYCPKKLEHRVEIILRMGLYQMLFLDRIPDRAAVDESVKLCGLTGCSRASGLVNAVLRSFLRAEKTYRLPDRERDKTKHYSIKYSCPEWIVSMWLEPYGEELCEKLLQSLSDRASVFIRVNTARISVDDLTQKLELRGVKVNTLPWLNGALQLDFSGGVEDLPEFREGLFHVQDAASQLCCGLLDPRSGDVICDVCAAPGGKSFTLSELASDACVLHSWDIHPHRVALIESGAKRLGLKSVKAQVRDAATTGEEIAARVLCDVPCSGLGVIRRKPDIMMKKPDELRGLPELQLRILEASASLLQPGGLLIYSTCTLNPAENGGVAEKFLSRNPEFEKSDIVLPKGISRAIDEPVNQLTLFPHIAETDGFFIASFRKRG